MNEIWKDVVGYEGIYQVSTLGRIKAKERIVNAKGNSIRKIREAIIQPEINFNGYLTVRLVNNGARMRHRIHLLVWDAFGNAERNRKNIVVDHIDNNKVNCRFDNLQLLTARENLIKGKKKPGRLTGAYFNGHTWFSQIIINGIRKYLGSFNNEIEAHKAYMTEKNLITSKLL